MVKSYKLHKFFGVSAGLVILLLSITGFLLDHDKWDFLYTTTFRTYPDSIANADKRLFSSYLISEQNPQHIFAASKRGLYESLDGGEHFKKTSSLQINAMQQSKNELILATSDGIYIKNTQGIEPFLLKDNYITALSFEKGVLAAVVDKKDIYLIDVEHKKIMKKLQVILPAALLQEDIKLSRFVRDLHYGRGFFDGILSLYFNDFAALILIFLAGSGFVIWYFIYQKKVAKSARKWIRYHANLFTVVAILPVLFLAVTGVFLDHSSGLRKFMKSVTISNTFLPPVYHALTEDIWSVDYDGKRLRIGNRYGVYGSDDLKKWQLESRGFAYSLSHYKSKIYVGGMGSANRVYEAGRWALLKHTPHMFKTVFVKDGDIKFFARSKRDILLPRFQDITLYSLVLSLHDGSFFASWWRWVDDYAAIAMIVLFFSGIIRWWRKAHLLTFSLEKKR